MNAAIKQAWIDALRSGTYQQGHQTLHNIAENTYCCLGVLCDLYLKEQGKVWDEEYSKLEVLPREVQLWSGLNWPNPTIDGYSLLAFNDYFGYTFYAIADLIEDAL